MPSNLARTEVMPQCRYLDVTPFPLETANFQLYDPGVFNANQSAPKNAERPYLLANDVNLVGVGVIY
ncbi:unnamed protein product [Fusarium venenatum]|uniref:Uncharacterized protein n=1 Tax=Fusarium venenatum TaxID=56646 RepID=A0A2L2TMG1_9HYPO|nr:uncharacterized protein FVRRES_03303 [Fusarium venenatum]CEI66791.1 unnamed protein product [Fusarium venenatum]